MNLAADQLTRLADWRPLFAALAGYAAVVVALAFVGKGEWSLDPRAIVRKINNALERITGLPGWAVAMVGTASFGVLVAGMGFYNDVNWHVSLGRDKQLFTAPHTAIVAGLMTIFASAFIGEFFATATKAELRTGGLRIRRLGLRIPYSAVAMGLLGFCALSGFPLDDLWHKTYGIDVTMWSPTHLLMIVGAGLSPIASWLALGEAGVKPEQSRWAMGLHIAIGAVSLLGLSAVQGEFAFGVPQFQQLYHPVLYALAGGFALTATAVVVKKWWSLLIVAGVGLILGTGDGFMRSSNGGARSASLYVVAAVAVALIAKFLGVERRLRFAVASGLAIGTVGLAGEWLWSQGGYQPWNASLLPQAPIYATVVGIAAALLAVAFGASIRGEAIGLSARPLVVAAVALLVALALPLPRPGLDAKASITLDHVKDGVRVHAVVTPVSAAKNAHWFQAMAWQGHGFRVTDMRPTGAPGAYVSDAVVPVGGKWKTMLRLHTGASMVSIPVFMPGDKEIGASEIPAVNKTMPFLTEQRYLLREQHRGPIWFSLGVYVILAAIASMWMGGFVLAARKQAPRAGAPAQTPLQVAHA